MMLGRKIVNGIGLLGAEYLIPFKMYAWLDLTEKKSRGEHVNEKDLKKHKYDVFRLLQIVTAGTKVGTSGLVKESIEKYIAAVEALDESEINLANIKLPFDRNQGIELLKGIYLNS